MSARPVHDALVLEGVAQELAILAARRNQLNAQMETLEEKDLRLEDEQLDILLGFTPADREKLRARLFVKLRDAGLDGNTIALVAPRARR